MANTVDIYLQASRQSLAYDAPLLASGTIDTLRFHVATSAEWAGLQMFVALRGADGEAIACPVDGDSAIADASAVDEAGGLSVAVIGVGDGIRLTTNIAVLWLYDSNVGR